MKDSNHPAPNLPTPADSIAVETREAPEAGAGNKCLVSRFSVSDDDAGSVGTGWFAVGSEGSEASAIPSKKSPFVPDEVRSWFLKLTKATALGPNDGSSERPTADAVPGRPAEYPEELTARCWHTPYNRLIKNFDGKAEMEARMEVVLKGLEQAYAGIDWKRLNMPRPDPFTAEAWHDTISAATGERFKLNEVRARAHEVRKLAEKFLKSIPRSQIMSDRCQNIHAKTDELLQSCSDVAWEAQIKNKCDRQQEVLDAVNYGIPDRVAHAGALIERATTEDDWSELMVQQEIRKITAALAQAKPLRDGGFEVEVNVEQCQKWHDNLHVYAEKTRPTYIESPRLSFADHRRHLTGMLRRLQKEGMEEFTPPEVPAKNPQRLPKISSALDPSASQQASFPQPPVAPPKSPLRPLLLGTQATEGAQTDSLQHAPLPQRPVAPRKSELRPLLLATPDGGRNNYSQGEDTSELRWKGVLNRVKHLDDQAFPLELEIAYWRQRSDWHKRPGSKYLAKALTDLKTAYESVSRDNLTMPQPEPFTRLEWLRRRADADAACDQVDAVAAQAREVLRIAEETLIKFRSNKFIPKEDGNCVELIVQKAEEILQLCKVDYLRNAIRLRHQEVLSEKLKPIESLAHNLRDVTEPALKAVALADNPSKWKDGTVQQKISDIRTAFSDAESLYKRGFDVRLDLERCQAWSKRLQGCEQDLESGDPETFERDRKVLISLLKQLASEDLKLDQGGVASQAGPGRRKVTGDLPAPPVLDDALTWARWTQHIIAKDDADLTQIGQEVKKLEVAFRACEWYIEIKEPEPFTVESWMHARNTALGWCRNAEILRERAKAVRDLADKVRSNWLARKPKMRLCDETIAAADALIAQCDRQIGRRNTIKSTYETRLVTYEDMVNVINGTIPESKRKHAKTIREMADLCLTTLAGVTDEGKWNAVPNPVRRITIQLSNAPFLQSVGIGGLSHQTIAKCIHFNGLLDKYKALSSIEAIDKKPPNESSKTGFKYHRENLLNILKDLKFAFE